MPQYAIYCHWEKKLESEYIRYWEAKHFSEYSCIPFCCNLDKFSISLANAILVMIILPIWYPLYRMVREVRW